MHQTYIGDIERGEKNVTLATDDKLAKGLGLTLAGLLLELKRDSGTTEYE
ncbi:MAG: helix-turn-helix domain-containing protein [Actinomycetota bacterium]|nr:helix-turn-helix domain-containing protein [Actinomycetota bacterium]